ncbi:MAG: hypothetical protein A3G87_00530 [Omnitrophica bacterium RIFCSPLOWO2_12_FULL_50_11]|nr:MAG: hypothetical protein A3G87_00530 [Omnitrophica bacterium RIFCSPLOWO2_12_FULL_50_11]
MPNEKETQKRRYHEKGDPPNYMARKQACLPARVPFFGAIVFPSTNGMFKNQESFAELLKTLPMNTISLVNP